MIVSLFIVLLVIGVIVFILGVKDDNIVYQFISMILFLVLFAQSIYITVPFLAATDATVYTIVEKQYIEPGLGAFCLIFVFTDVVLLVVEFVDRRKKKQGPHIPGGLT